MTQTKIIPIVNKNLFSDHYIKERLPQKLEEWGEEEKNQAQGIRGSGRTSTPAAPGGKSHPRFNTTD
ncbi:MAG: hypothetical protein KJ886_01210, partial [Candidatus Thermoplasmatota archaeon]|nr:hypothetical protein [Candidatus Thermoplasmatota archaeon]